MNVKIKNFNVEMDVKNSGIEFEIRSTNGGFLGDLFLTKSGLTWCKGKTTRKRGKKMSWDKFIETIETIGSK